MIRGEKRSVWRLLTRKAVKALLHEEGWQQDSAASERMHRLTRDAGFNIYVHDDGRGLYIAGDAKGKLYLAKADMYAFIDFLEQLSRQKPQHILKDRLPYGEDFIEHVPELIEQLPAKLKIEPEALDETFASLQLVEAAVLRQGRTRCLEPAIFAPLVAYIGEVMRKFIDGRWEMQLSPQDHETWEPWIFDSEGRACNSWSSLYDALVRDGKYASISGGAGVDVQFRRPFPLGSSQSSGFIING